MSLEINLAYTLPRRRCPSARYRCHFPPATAAIHGTGMSSAGLGGWHCRTGWQPPGWDEGSKMAAGRGRNKGGKWGERLTWWAWTGSHDLQGKEAAVSADYSPALHHCWWLCPPWAAAAPAHTAQHVVVGVVSDGVDVWRCLGAPLPLVGRHHGRSVDRQPFVGVDGDAEEPRIGLWVGRGWLRWPGAPAALPLMAGGERQGPPGGGGLHRSSSGSSGAWGCRARRPRWDASAWPCLQSCRTWGGSWPAAHLPSPPASARVTWRHWAWTRCSLQPYIFPAPLWRPFSESATSAPWDPPALLGVPSLGQGNSHSPYIVLSTPCPIKEVCGYLGQQLKCIPHHFKLDPFNPANPSLGELSPYISGCKDLDLANGLVNASEAKSLRDFCFLIGEH